MTEWQKEMATWLATFHWDLFCSLTFKPYLTIKQRQELMRKWIAAMKHQFGDLHWFAVPESGRTGNDYHYHILVGGLADPTTDDRRRAMNLWTSGDAQISIFTPGENGIAYILKNAGPQTEIEFELSERTRMQSCFGK